jgi:hypothetical protein
MKASILRLVIRKIKDQIILNRLHKRFSVKTIPIEVEKKLNIRGVFRKGF